MIGQASDTAFQFDPSLAVNLRINRKVRLEFLGGREDSEDLSKERWRVRFGVSLKLKPLVRSFDVDPDDDKKHFIVLRTFYERSHAEQAGLVENEDRVALEATPRHWWPGKLLTSDRNRLEFRWINGTYSFRYRNRFRVERPVRFDKVRLIPYGAVEAYWDGRFDRWNQFKFTGGSEVPFGKKASVDVYFDRRHCLSCPSSQINVVGLSLNLFFKLRR